MNPVPDAAWWLRLLALLAAEAAVLVALAAAAARLARTPHMRRAAWQGCLVALALAWTAELAGLRDALPTHASAASRTLDARVAFPAAPATPAGTAAPANAPGIVTATGDSPAPDAPLRWPAALWLAGTTLVLLRAAAGRLALARRLRGATRPDADDGDLHATVDRLARALGLCRIRVLTWPSLRGPVAFGIARPTIALPGGFAARFAPAQRDAMVAHELAHLAGRDPLWTLVADVVCALAWWHPGAWWMRRRLREANESVADAASALVPGGPVALAESLVAFGRELAGAEGLGVGGDGRPSELVRRVQRLLEDPREWRVPGVLRAWTPRLVAALLGLAFASVPVALAVGGSPLRTLAARPAPEAVPAPTPARVPRLDTVPVASVPPVQAAPALTLEPPRGGIAVATNVVEYVASGEGDVRVVPQPRPIPPAPAARPTPAAPPAAPDLPPPPVPPAPAPRQVLLNVRLLELHRPLGTRGAGFEWIFGPEPSGDPLPEGTGPSSLGAAITNIPGLRLEHAAVSANWGAITEAQLAALLKTVKDSGGVDLVSAPKVLTLAGREAEISVGDTRALVTGPTFVPASDGKPASIHYGTNSVATGVTIGLLPGFESAATPAPAGREAMTIRTSVRYTEFNGYDQPPRGSEVTGKDARGRVLRGTPSLPRLRVREAAALLRCNPGEAVVMRGPNATNVVRTVDRVVGLGDVPLLGRLFTKHETRTNVSLFYVIVEPVEVDAAGNAVRR